MREVQVAAVVDEFLGTSAYMEIGALRDLMREGGVVTGAFLQVDSSEVDRLLVRLKNTPSVAAVALKDASAQAFRDTVQQNIGVIVFFNQIFSSVIAFGVVYNAARISLSERSWELASLRVIGFTKREIAYILLGEFALLTAIAIPTGLLLGYGLAWFTVETIGSNELYRIPLVVGNNTYGRAAISVLVATMFSSMVIWRKLNRLDLVGVLKTRD